jgi:hypothetical protein
VELLTEPTDVGIAADVVAVEVSGSEGSYSFSVTVSSRETGCDQYADWWEVVSDEGELLYRRVLLHSHVGEQPFARSGGPVAVAADQAVWVRAHMNTTGYAGKAQRRTAADGFAMVVLAADFAAGVAGQEPLPQGCDFLKGRRPRRGPLARARVQRGRGEYPPGRKAARRRGARPSAAWVSKRYWTFLS